MGKAAVNLQQLLHYNNCTSITALQQLHFNYCTTTTALQLLHYNNCTSITALQQLHFNYCTTTTALQLLHYNNCTSITALQQLHFNYCTTTIALQWLHRWLQQLHFGGPSTWNQLPLMLCLLPGTMCLISAKSFLSHFSMVVAVLRAPLSRFLEGAQYKYP